jgi:M6 family metalloprotease domain
VVGPVTLSKPMAYYGQNDVDGNDKHPDEMVYEACKLAAKSVDFSNFDYDNDGYVDDVYIYYAGMGEADGGSANTIWPHSWSLSSAGLSLTLNGKIVDAYSCSAELDGTGSRSGIGSFTHEYGHLLGLADMYDVDYDSYNGEGFDLGEWSLMAYGSYNGNGCVPPCLTILERKLLGWANPTALTNSASLTLPDLGSSSQGYMITTKDSGEYYLLENRQKNANKWDQYLLGHGMLVYHVDMRSDASTSLSYYGTPVVMTYEEMWTYNMVNAIKNHQCADIVEADNLRTYYTNGNASAYILGVKGDPFPGTSGIALFTDVTSPSMAIWNGTLLDKPITNIKEKNGVISFDFRGGALGGTPTALSASGTENYKFTANWDSLSRATAYYLDIYTLDATSGDLVKTYVPGYENFMVKDTSYTINYLDDNTTYYYVVRATNNYVTTANSATISVTTPKATHITPYAKDRVIYLKGMDRGATVRIYDTMGILRYTSNSNSIAVDKPGIYLVETAFEGKRVIIKIAVR